MQPMKDIPPSNPDNYHLWDISAFEDWVEYETNKNIKLPMTDEMASMAIKQINKRLKIYERNNKKSKR